MTDGIELGDGEAGKFQAGEVCREAARGVLSYLLTSGALATPSPKLEKRDQPSLTTSPRAWLFICWAELSETSGPTGRDRLSGQCGPEAYTLRGASPRKQGVWAQESWRVST